MGNQKQQPKKGVENFIRGVRNSLVKTVLVVERLDNDFLIELRRDACNSCKNNQNGKCKICKCIIEIKTATKINRTKTGGTEITHCPEGKWGDEELANLYNNKK